YDRSAPLRVLHGRPVAKDGGSEGLTREDILPHPAATGGADPLVARRAAATRAAPTVSASFDGIGADGLAPPDTNMAVGPHHLLQIVNTRLEVLDKSGAVVLAPKATNAVFSSFGGPCETTNDGDGIVRYDRQADRWLISQFAFAQVDAAPYFECIAISTGSDPTGAYNRYAFQYTSFPDYPKVGIWPDAYYVTYNMFANGSSFSGGQACAMDRARMLAGLSATQLCFTTNAAYGGLLPADLDGTKPPPAGAPNVMLSVGSTATSLASWKFHADFATPANSTFSGPTALSVASYSAACDGGTCIPQPGTTTKLDSLADRLMYRLAYRNLGDHESLVITHSVVAGSSTGVRWYELRLVGGNPTVYQQGTYAPDSSYRWMGSAAMDGAGNIGVGYSVASSTVKASIRVAGRLVGDPLGQLTQAEASLQVGSGSQTGSLTRWGDYASMDVDPADDCTLWFTSEYLAANGAFNWHTRIGSFVLPGCLTPTLTVAKAGLGHGTVSSTPAGITCGADCTQDVPRTTVVTLTATPASGSAFGGWSGAGCSGTSTCKVTMTTASTVTATFKVLPPTCTPPMPVPASATASQVTVNVGPCTAGGPAPTGYRVTIYPDGSSTPLATQNLAVSATSATFAGLTPGTDYRFRAQATNVGGSGPSSAYSGDAVPPFHTVDGFVRQQYLDFTGALPTAAQLADWTSKITDQTRSAFATIDLATQLPQWGPQIDPITRLYQAYFKRIPDTGGLGYWLKQRRSGAAGLANVSDGFAHSKEFTSTYGPLTNADFVDLVYKNVLGRPGDSTGVGYWVKKLNAGMTRGTVMLSFSESPEFTTKRSGVVNTVSVFYGLLRRAPTGAELSTWEAPSKTSRLPVITFVIGTAEYDARAS
ncbi:MAG: hypothetical protein JWN46_1203, partial [Acidimicrobiales bacterium]|nr:hypothetical protein [Acidimicrobiales bacterium]